MYNIIMTVISVLALIILLYHNYQPKIEIVITGKDSYRIYLWYKKYTKYGRERTYKLLYRNEKL